MFLPLVEDTLSGSVRVPQSELKNNLQFSKYTGKKKVEAAITAAKTGDTRFLK